MARDSNKSPGVSDSMGTRLPSALVTRVPKRKQLDEPPPEEPPPEEPPPDDPPPELPPPDEPPPDDPPPELLPPELPPPLDPPPLEPALLPADEPTPELSSVLWAELPGGVELLTAELPGVVLLVLDPGPPPVLVGGSSVELSDELDNELDPPPVGACPVAQTGRYK